VAPTRWVLAHGRSPRTCFLEEDVGLTNIDLDANMRTLGDPPEGFTELRAALLEEQERRAHGGLVDRAGHEEAHPE